MQYTKKDLEEKEKELDLLLKAEQQKQKKIQAMQDKLAEIEAKRLQLRDLQEKGTLKGQIRSGVLWFKSKIKEKLKNTKIKWKTSGDANKVKVNNIIESLTK